MMRPALTAALIVSLIGATPGFGQQAPRRDRDKLQAPQKPQKPVDESAPATQPDDEDPAPSHPQRSDLRRSRISRDVDRSIRRAVKFLLSRQRPNGSWAVEGENEDLIIGTTALVTLALLSGGESHQSPAVAKAVKFLKAAPVTKVHRGVYTVALRAAVYANLPAATARKELEADLRALRAAMIDEGPYAGMYTYGAPGKSVRWADYSNSQYAVLGVWYGAMAGVEVPERYWRDVERGWLEGRNEDGGWSYTRRMNRSYASMTAAAAATLFITYDHLHRTSSRDLNAEGASKEARAAREALDGAMGWLAEHFAVDHNPGIDTNIIRANKGGDLEAALLDQLLPVVEPDPTWLHYLLFSYERVGEASGLTRFGRRKWFDEGATQLLKTQRYDGSWEADLGEEIDTAYALLFLARGRAPVVAQKLQFEGRWNNRPRDLAAFVQFMRRASERHVNWQVVSIDDSPGELREAPILYIASDRPAKFNEQQREKLKQYVLQGGLILAVNEGNEDAFARSIASLAADLFPRYQFRDLPPDHPIYTANFPANWTDPIRGMSNGVRDLIILMPGGDASWKWMSAGGAFDVQRAPYGVLANLHLHVTDKSNPRYKGEDAWIDRNPGVTPTRTARLARIQYDGNWDPEPGGWVRLSNVTWNFDQTRLETGAFTPEQLPSLIAAPPSTPGQSGARAAPPRINGSAPQCNLAHLTATGSFTLTAPQINALRKYTDAGGVLLLDACGGNSEAAIAFETLIQSMYPGAQLAPLPLDHPIYRAASLGGQDIDQVTYRRSVDRPQTKLPRLKQATTSDGKLIAILSNEDLSAGLVGYQTAGPIGYTPQSATDLMRNIILWSASRG